MILAKGTLRSGRNDPIVVDVCSSKRLGQKKESRREAGGGRQSGRGVPLDSKSPNFHRKGVPTGRTPGPAQKRRLGLEAEGGGRS